MQALGPRGSSAWSSAWALRWPLGTLRLGRTPLVLSSTAAEARRPSGQKRQVGVCAQLSALRETLSCGC